MDKYLYIVATPIGNLEDITLRALEVLKQAEVVLCEDTRQSKKLMERYEIKQKLISLHQHSSEDKIKALLNQYSNIAYISDAGTPGISDPGGKVVELALQNEFQVVPIPGPAAVISALSISGLPTDKFLFLGFLPHKHRNKVFKTIVDSDCTVCFYESPHRIMKTLYQLNNLLEPDRKVVACRELTKKFETIYRGNIAEVLKEVEAKPKGEFTLVIGGRK